MTPPPAAAPKKATKVAKAGSGTKTSERRSSDADVEDWKRGKVLLKPDDQLDLPESELKEEVPRILTSLNPQLPDALVEYSYAESQFVRLPSPGNAVVVLDYQGTCIPKDCEEARHQMMAAGIDPGELSLSIGEEGEEEGEAASEEKKEEAPPEAAPETAEKAEGEGGEADEGGEAEGGGEEKAEGEGEGEAEEGEEAAAPAGKPKKLTNQFNFCERAALTYNNPLRCQETQTIPPPRANYSGLVLQWIIYDAYAKDFEAKQREKEKELGKKKHKKEQRKTKAHAFSAETQKKLFEAWKTLERMVNLNTYDDIAQDFRFWEDPSDEFRDGEGTCLPLWRFVYEKTKKMVVTDLMWNPWYYDLFAVCFGSYDYLKQVTTGSLCLFSLKNPSFPEHICMTESGVMCVDIHPNFPYFVVVGQFDGNVLVYNVQASCKQPQYKSNAITNKHDNVVWEVKWGKDLQEGELNFYSAASDGKINCWVLLHNELQLTTIITVFLNLDPVIGPDGCLMDIKGCASCLSFHPEDQTVFLVGTEEGHIYKCSTAFASTYVFTFEGHELPVYRIDFNRFNSDIFVSCSADWTIKVWEDNRHAPLFIFDVGTIVGDVKWAPYSSTVFAAVTNDGRVYIFDINVNKYKAICTQSIVSKKRNKLLRLSFNEKMPVLIVGDDKGCITTLKLSPNLRVMCKPPKKQQHLDQRTLQVMKLDKLLSLVREPNKLERPPDKAGSEDS